MHPQKLGSVTKKRNFLDTLLEVIPVDIQSVKFHFTDYLERVERLYEACKSEEEITWLEPHKEAIEAYRSRIQGFIDTTTHPPKSIISMRSNSSRKSNQSAVSAARLEVARNKAKLEAERLAMTVAYDLERKELELTRKYEDEKVKLEHEKRLAEYKKNLLENELIDQELDKCDESSNGSGTSRRKPRSRSPSETPALNSTSVEPVSNAPYNEKLLMVLENQNKISQSLIQNQKSIILPNQTIESFSGNDITEFKTFLTRFKNVIENNCKSDYAKFTYLEQYTSGNAKKLVQSCNSYDPSQAYSKAMQLLCDEYNNEFKVSNALIAGLDKWGTLGEDDLDSFEDLAFYLLRCSNHLESLSIGNQLNNPKEIMNIVMKLPYRVRDGWRRITGRIQGEGKQVMFEDLVTFVREEVGIRKQPIFGAISGENSPVAKVPQQAKRTMNSRTDTEQQGSEEMVTDHQKLEPCPCCKKDNHDLSSCHFFKTKTYEEKVDFIKINGICFGCLKATSHLSKQCLNRLECERCHRLHPTVLHRPSYSTERVNHESGNNQSVSRAIQGEEVGRSGKFFVKCPIVAARLRNPLNDKEQIVNVALDTHSTDCWISPSVVDSMELETESCTTYLTTMHEENRRVEARFVRNLIIGDIDNNKQTEIPRIFMKRDGCWPFSKDEAPTYEDISEQSHLRELPFQFIDADVGVLIGLNMPGLLRPLQVIEGSFDQPYATRHWLGWALNGPTSRIRPATTCNRTIASIHDIEENLEKLFSKDFVEETNELSSSIKERTWISKVESSIRKTTDGHIEIGLPIRDDAPKLVSNRHQAERSIKYLKSRFDKDPKYYEDYRKCMETMIKENFVEIVPKEDSNEQCWYITHHGVYHKQKNKFRVVFNCSLKYHGVSLNDMLLQGPDLTNNLVGVLMRFRKLGVAVVGDIEKMYYQVRVPPEHRDYFRFFWMNTEGNLVLYRMTVHVFGAVSSPSIANFALQYAAKENMTEQARETVLRNFYVDDMLKSFDTAETAITLTTSLKSALASSGFNLTEFKSNVTEVTEALVSPDETKKEIKLTEEKALGITWDTKTDTLSFGAKMQDQVTITRRSILKIVASFYDPHGLISPFLVVGKKIFQSSFLTKTNWDDPVSEDLAIAFRSWLSSARDLENYCVPRCFIDASSNLDQEKVELHIFCDGSEMAYAAVAYLRIENRENIRVSSPVFAKSKLAPIGNKTIRTIPRVELCAAKVGIEVFNLLRRELDIENVEGFFWSDSQTVLAYIKNESKKFHRFVANKVSFIRNYSSPDQWRHVPSRANSSDILSRGCTVSALKVSELWNKGPPFLRTAASTWIVEENCTVNPDDVEIKSLKVTTPDEPDIFATMHAAYSCWHKLKRAYAWMAKFKDFLLKRKFSNKIVLEEIQRAEVDIIRNEQRMHLPADLSARNVPKFIRKLNPFKDSENVVRVGGRLTKLQHHEIDAQPKLLPANSHVSLLLMRNAHVSAGHLGTRSIIAQTRNKYWILGANKLARALVRDCITCRRYHSPTMEQQMAPIHSTRLALGQPCFHHTGCDYFGPFIVTNERKTMKRYGVVFTCMTSRAIHLEIAHDMTTNSFINTLRRFVARRGTVATISSDNGSNLRGAERELRLQIRAWNQEHIEQWLQQSDIAWKFNPVGGSHFGATWEREIRTIRKIFSCSLMDNTRKLNDESLLTLFCEIEAILNNRPIAELSTDPEDLEALTPNHLLLNRQNFTLPPCPYSTDDSHHKAQWRRVQHNAEVFWNRFRKEYLTTLQVRNKWMSRRPNLKSGDLVLVADINLPRNQWPLGRVSRVIISDDQVCRVAYVKINKYRDADVTRIGSLEIKRPIVKLVLLRAE